MHRAVRRERQHPVPSRCVHETGCRRSPGRRLALFERLEQRRHEGADDLRVAGRVRMQRVVPEAFGPLPGPVVHGAQKVDARHVPRVDQEVHPPCVLVLDRRKVVACVAQRDDGDDVVLPAAFDEAADPGFELAEDGVLRCRRGAVLNALVAERQADQHVARIHGKQVADARIGGAFGREARRHRLRVVAAARLVQHFPASRREQFAQPSRVAFLPLVVAGAVGHRRSEHGDAPRRRGRLLTLKRGQPGDGDDRRDERELRERSDAHH